MSDARIILSAEDKTAAAVQSAKRGFNELQSVAGTLQSQLALVGGAATIGGFMALVKGANDAIDALNDVVDATGSTIENVSALERVSRLYGHQTELSTTLLMKFNKELTGTIKPGSEAESVLKQLGLSAAELRRIDPAEALQRTAIALEQFANNGDRARATEILFGKATREGAAYLKDLAESGALVATVTTQQAEEAEKFNRELLKLKASGNALAQTLAMELVPALNNMFDSVRVKQPTVTNFFRDIENSMRRMAPTLSMFMYAVRATSLALSDEKPIDFNSMAGAGRGSVNPATVKPALAFDPQAEAKRLAALTAAQTAAEKQLNEERKRSAEIVKLRNQLAEQNAKDEVARLEALGKGQAEWLALITKEADLRRKNSQEYLDGIDKQIFAASAAVEAAQWEFDTYGKTTAEIARMTLARLEDARAVQLLTALTFEDLRAIDAQIAAQKRLIDIYTKGDLRSANEETARKAREEWDRAFQQVGQSFADYLMEGGKNAADYISALFRTLVLRPIISAAVNPVAGAVTSALGMGGPGGLGSAGGMLGGQISGFGMGLNATMQNGFMNFGANAANIGAMVEGGSYAQAIGASSPYIAAAIAAYKVIKSLEGGETRSGGQYNSTNLLAAPSGGQIDAGNITSAIGATTGSINAYLARFGSKTRLGEYFSGLETSENGKGFAYAGGTLSTGRVFGQGQDGMGYMNRRGNFNGEQAVTAFGEELSQSVLQALQADLDNLPDYVRKYLAGIDVDAMGKDAADKLLASIDAVATQRATLEQQIYELTTTDAQKLLDVRTKEREAIDSSNAPLLDRVYALQDEERAAAAATAAASDKARMDEQIASQRQNLQTQLWQMEGNTAALRQAELQALDPSNRALQQHIWALQDQAAAAQTARAAQDRYNQSITEANQFLAGVGQTIGGYLARLSSTDAGLLAPGAQLVNARELYQQQLALARGGDRNALGNITQYADTFINASKAYSGSGGATMGILQSIQGELRGLPTQVRPEQLIVDALGQTTAAVTSGNTSLITALQTSFTQLDTSLNGMLDLKEFTQGLSKFASEDTLRSLFTSFDTNGDGQLTRLEALGATADKQLAAADLQNKQLEAIVFQQRQLDAIWQRSGAQVDYLGQLVWLQTQDAQRQDFNLNQNDAIWRRLGELINMGGAGGGGGFGDLILKVVTPSGTEITNTVIGNIKDRSRNGEIVVYASGVGA